MARIRLVVLLVLAVVSVIGGAAAKPRPGDPWKTLRRPLHVPRLGAAEPCPLSSTRSRGRRGVALGEEPPYALSFPKGALDLRLATSRADGWFAYRTRWLADAHTAGPLLVRGVRLDRPAPVRFSSRAAGDGRRELRLRFSAGKGSRLSAVAYTLVRTPGCFALQADGRSFSNVLVFVATIG